MDFSGGGGGVGPLFVLHGVEEDRGGEAEAPGARRVGASAVGSVRELARDAEDPAAGGGGGAAQSGVGDCGSRLYLHSLPLFRQVDQRIR